MAPSKPAEPSPLVAAAHAFDEALQRLSALAEALRLARLDSGHGLQRAAEMLTQIGQRETEVQQCAQALGSALAAARDAQQAEAEAVHARALEIQRRTEAYGGILARFEALGADAGKLNVATQALAAHRTAADQALRDGDLPSLLSELDELQERMTALAGASDGLAADARAVEFADLHRRIDSLRQQLLAARNKIGLLKQAIVKAVPSDLIC